MTISGFFNSSGIWESSYALNSGNFVIPKIRFGYVDDIVKGIRPAFQIDIPDYKSIESPSILFAVCGTGGLSNSFFNISSAMSLNPNVYVDVVPSNLALVIQ
ncbi:hypothetical protein IHC92_20740 [Photobacterium damselae subsp. damselae]|uniref:hypothetical protein n=1 Tax=Photobacterium damselae TaxID=38293 RepID=UPI001F2437F1|nr:hypothetical protein [Photobacterium damselae]UKA23382.1 hypothetical protein IHC92_20740 [Photobacterium damselae subsp. damselae]